MVEQKNKSIADTFNSRIKTPWVWLVLAITVGLTILFYFSQKPQIILYSRYIKNLSEYQLQESLTLRSMDRIRTGLGSDTVLIQAQTMTLREIAVSFSREMDDIRAMGVGAPSYEAVGRFEREVLSKVAGMRRYAVSRTAWFADYRRVDSAVVSLPPASQLRIRSMLDSARSGYVVALSDSAETSMMGIPDSLRAQMETLFRNNEDLALAWSRLSDGKAVMHGDDLIQFFQMENLNEIALKSRIPMAFYFLCLVLLLSTFFFVFRSRQ